MEILEEPALKNKKRACCPLFLEQERAQYGIIALGTQVDKV
jgi:hypothetical protein